MQTSSEWDLVPQNPSPLPPFARKKEKNFYGLMDFTLRQFNLINNNID